jgi:hypothetical protein
MKNRNLANNDNWITPLRFVRGRIINTKGEKVDDGCGMFDNMICIMDGRMKGLI